MDYLIFQPKFTCLGEIGMGSGYNTHVTASEQGGVVKEPKIFCLELFIVFYQLFISVICNETVYVIVSVFNQLFLILISIVINR